MTRKFTRILAAFALLTLIVLPIKVWADTATFSYTDFTGQGSSGSGGNLTGATHGNITITGKGYGNNSYLQVYANNYLTITPSNGATITKIELTGTSNTYIRSWSASDNSVVAISGSKATWSGSSTSVITLTNTASAQARITTIEVTYSVPSSYTITALSSNTSWGTVSLSGTTITATPANGYRVSTTTPYTVSPEGSATVSQNGNQFNVTPSANTTVTINFEAIPTHTITFNAGSGTCDTPTTSGLEGSTIVLPTAVPSQACVSRDWTFAGWATASVTETTTAPTLLSGNYTINGNATLYAVYKVTEGEGGTTEFNFAEIAEANDWENGVAYTEVTIAPVTIEAQGGGNNGKWYTTGDGSWRMYSGGTVLVSTTSNNVTAVISSPSCDFTINNGTASYSPSARTDFTSITVTYGTYTTTYNSNPSCLPMVATPTFTPAAGTYTGAQNVAIECDTDGATILYKTAEEGEWQTYSAAIPVSTTTTIWAKATNNGMDDSEVAEATYTIQYTLTVNIDDVVEYFLFDYSNETWDEITLDENGQALVSSGADVRISGGEVYDDCYEVESFDVTDGNDDPVTVVDYTDDDGTYSFIMPASNATLTATLNEIADHYTLTVEGMEHVSFEMLVGSMSTITSLNANHEASICEGSEVTISEITVDYGYALETVELIYDQQVHIITPTSDVCVFDMPSSNVVLIIIVREIPTYTYTLATSIESGKSYIIVGQDNGNYFAMGQQNNNNRAAVGISVDVNNNKATVASEDVYEFVIESVGENVYSIFDDRNNNNVGGYLYAASSDHNYLKTEAELDANGKWAISIGEGGAASVVAQGNYTHKYMRFNINSSNNNPLFSCYASTSELPKVYLFEKTYTYTLTIEGYGESTGGYYLIASPVTVDPEDAGMITDHFTGEELTPATSTYDLYYFDQTAEKEWKNYRNSTFDLVPGTGYLYASKEGGEFTLTGNELYNGDGVIPLTQGSGNWADWNLIGNPFGVGAVIYNDYYVMNPEGSGLIPGVDHHVTAMQGVFVKYDPELLGAGFYPDTDPYGITSVQSEDRLVFNLLRNRGTLIDRAIVRFGEGRQMTKFTLFENNTKLYIPLEDDDYAIVRSEAQGELPVSFRASENGTYTLSMNVENVDMNYLHLIDNMTGMDIDLLQTPSYTFEANTNDYANRFKLVFAANGTDEADESSFAFFSNGNLIVNNEGNATLQVIDINGRILSSETISGSCSKAINATTGVYMLRLINGDNVKVQKVVVR